MEEYGTLFIINVPMDTMFSRYLVFIKHITDFLILAETQWPMCGSFFFFSFYNEVNGYQRGYAVW